MRQEIDGKMVEVVDFDTMPELPITGLTDSERLYQAALLGASAYHETELVRIPLAALGHTITYAQALTDAIKTGIITEPGKYGIELHHATKSYTIHKIIEP